MIDNLFGGDDEDTAEDADEEDIGGLFDDPGDGLDADGDDLSVDGGEDLVGGDGALGGGDDLAGDDDLMGGGGEGGATNGEVTKRLDELENEVDSLSSAVNTVKSENEQLSGTIDDVEENIRKLLEVYEMVTRGVNPFVNEDEFGDAFGGAGGGGGDSGSMALFGGDEEEEAETADIDESVANADADDFFEDDLEEGTVDDVGDDGVFEDDGDVDASDGDGGGDDGDDGSGEFEETFDDVEDFDDAGDFEENHVVDDGDGGGGKSFEDLKSKYETGADGDGPAEGDGSDGDATDGSDPAGGTLGVPDDDAVEGDKPYLQAVPGGYAADVVVLEWLEFLVDEAGVDGAARTISYYEAIEWVSETASEHLQTYLRGFGDDVVEDPEPRSWLTVTHHETSLRFISRIDDPSMGLVAFDDRVDRGRAGAWSGNDRRSGLVTDEVGGHRGEVGSTAASGPELESDGGRRTPEEGGGRTPEEGGAAYEPAATRRRRGRYGDGNDAGDHTCEVGYGGFCWNHEGR